MLPSKKQSYLKSYLTHYPLFCQELWTVNYCFINMPARLNQVTFPQQRPLLQ